MGLGVGCGLPPLIRMDGLGDSCRAVGCAGGGRFLVVGSSCHLSSGGESHSNHRSRRFSVGRYGRWRVALPQRTVGMKVLVEGHSIRPWCWYWRGYLNCYGVQFRCWLA